MYEFLLVSVQADKFIKKLARKGGRIGSVVKI